LFTQPGPFHCPIDPCPFTDSRPVISPRNCPCRDSDRLFVATSLDPSYVSARDFLYRRLLWESGIHVLFLYLPSIFPILLKFVSPTIWLVFQSDPTRQIGSPVNTTPGFRLFISPFFFCPCHPDWPPPPIGPNPMSLQVSGRVEFRPCSSGSRCP